MNDMSEKVKPFLYGFLGAAVFTALFHGLPAVAQTAKGLVVLQTTTPGTAQSGNTNVAGTSRAGQFQGGGAGLTGVDADLLDGLNSSAFLQGIPTPLSLTSSVSGGSVITGTNSHGATSSNGLHGIGGTGVQGTGSYAGVSGDASVIGVYGDGGEYGGYFRCLGFSGYGVYGLATGQFSTNMVGVYGKTTSLGGSGVKGEGARDTGQTWGVYGFTPSTAGTGVFGEARATSGNTVGVWGRSVSPTGYGTFGDGGTNNGVVGIGDNYGVYSFGRLGASGLKTFRIDHPLDPENKWLMHYSSEGPEPLNIYSGAITTDDKGFAVILLPDYFTEINRDARVLLTVDDESDDFVMAKVVGGVQSGQCRIRTSKPTVKVYWEVKAVRNDLWVREHGAPVEPDKADHERGKYQHPELYGLGPEMGMIRDEQERTTTTK